jgi:hypothetical protein
MGKLRGKRGCVAAIALCALLALAPASALAAVPAFCKGRVVRDDARPLRYMPGEHPPPEGELPFGPRNLSMYALNFGAKVVLDGGHLGYRFAAKGGNARVLHLNWDVRAVLKKVDDRGRALGTVGTVHRRLGEVEGLEELQFSFPAHPGLYQVDISFRTLAGRELASYSEHFRVVPRRVKLRVAVSGETFKAGETAYARVFNLGTPPAGRPRRGRRLGQSGRTASLPRERQGVSLDGGRRPGFAVRGVPSSRRRRARLLQIHFLSSGVRPGHPPPHAYGRL